MVIPSLRNFSLLKIWTKSPFSVRILAIKHAFMPYIFPLTMICYWVSAERKNSIGIQQIHRWKIISIHVAVTFYQLGPCHWQWMTYLANVSLETPMETFHSWRLILITNFIWSRHFPVTQVCLNDPWNEPALYHGLNPRRCTNASLGTWFWFVIFGQFRYIHCRLGNRSASRSCFGIERTFRSFGWSRIG